MKKETELPPLAKRKHVCGRRRHYPTSDVRSALYLMLGVDLTELEGVDELNALTLNSELEADFATWPTLKHFTNWLALCQNFKKTGGKVRSSKNPGAEGNNGDGAQIGADLVRGDALRRGLSEAK